MTHAMDRQPDGKTTIVVPCYNEATRLDLPAFATFLDRSDDVSLLLVDDGSSDDTPQMLESLRVLHPARVSVYRSVQNAGKAEAVRRGVQLALRRRLAFVGYWDADLATPLKAVCDFRDVLLNRPELMLVIGSRVALLGRQIHRRFARHLLGRAFATAASLVLGLSVYDTQCGAKLFRVTPATIGLFDNPFRSRWIFDVELLARLVAAARASGGRPAHELIYECPLDRWHDVAGSRLAPHDFVFAAADLVAICWRYSRRPFRRRAEVELPSSLPQPLPAANEATRPAQRDAA